MQLSTVSPLLSESSDQELALCSGWPTYWRFSFSINPFSEYAGLMSCRTTLVVTVISCQTVNTLC